MHHRNNELGDTITGAPVQGRFSEAGAAVVRVMILAGRWVDRGDELDANYQPAFDSDAKLPHFVAGLLQRGLQEAEVAKLIGGNFLRLFAAVQAV